MMAPKYMRAMLFGAVIEAAVQELDEPIGSVEIGIGVARVKAAGRTLFFAFQLEHSSDDRGAPVLGSDRWVVSRIESPDAPVRFAFGRWLKSRLGRG